MWPLLTLDYERNSSDAGTQILSCLPVIYGLIRSVFREEKSKLECLIHAIVPCNVLAAYVQICTISRIAGA